MMAAVALAHGSGVQAQVVRGTVTLTDGGAPAHGAFVRLIDAKGQSEGGVLTDALGRYTLPVSTEGPFRLRVELIGRRVAEIGPMSVAEGEVFEWSPVLPPRPLALSGIDVEVRPRCEVRPEEGTVAAAVWDEARKALEVALWAEEQELFRYDVRSYRRELDPERERIVAEESEREAGYFRRPFAGLPSEDLIARGFVQETSEGTFAYAPDARTLLAEGFVDNHCFRVERGGEGRIALAFEPTRERRVTDIRGVMWLDERTGELRSVRYRYVRFPGTDPDLDLGGRVEFEQLPSGAWIVRRWNLEMPVVADVRRPEAVDVWDRRTVGIMEEGGEVLTVVDREGRAILTADRATLAGTVFDSIRGRLLTGAEVRLVGTDHRVLTGPDGRFVLTDLPGGSYRIAFTHPRVDSLGLRLEAAPVDLVVGEATNAPLLVPTTVPAEPGSPPHVRGEVLEPSGEAPVAGAMVSLVDAEGTVRDADFTDERGWYALEAPAPGRYRMTVEEVGRELGRTETLELTGELVRHHSLVFEGSVVDLEGAVVSAPSPCVVDAPPGSPTARAWTEVRKALAMVTVGRDDPSLGFLLTQYERERAASGKTVDERWERVNEPVRHGFGEVPRAEDGRPRFVETSDSTLVAATPGSRFLSSPWFRDHYCRRLVASPSGPSTVALLFQPTDSTGAPSVRGLFVLDRASGALRSVHYRYVSFPTPAGPGVPGGWMSFDRLPAGPFFVSEWEARLPRVVRFRDMVPRTWTDTNAVQASRIVRGGWVRAARDEDGGLLWRRTAPRPSEASADRLWATGSVLEPEEARGSSTPPSSSPSHSDRR